MGKADTMRNQADTGNLHISGGTKRGLVLLNRNYVIDVDSNNYKKLQSTRRVGNYYTKLINERVFKGQKPTPLLSPERSAMIESVRKAAFGVRNHSMAPPTAIKDRLEMGGSLHRAASNQGDANHEDSMIRLPRLIGVLS